MSALLPTHPSRITWERVCTHALRSGERLAFVHHVGGTTFRLAQRRADGTWTLAKTQQMAREVVTVAGPWFCPTLTLTGHDLPPVPLEVV